MKSKEGKLLAIVKSMRQQKNESLGLSLLQQPHETRRIKFEESSGLF